MKSLFLSAIAMLACTCAHAEHSSQKYYNHTTGETTTQEKFDIPIPGANPLEVEIEVVEGPDTVQVTKFRTSKLRYKKLSKLVKEMALTASEVFAESLSEDLYED